MPRPPLRKRIARPLAYSALVLVAIGGTIPVYALAPGTYKGTVILVAGSLVFGIALLDLLARVGTLLRGQEPSPLARAATRVPDPPAIPEAFRRIADEVRWGLRDRRYFARAVRVRLLGYLERAPGTDRQRAGEPIEAWIARDPDLALLAEPLPKRFHVWRRVPLARVARAVGRIEELQ